MRYVSICLAAILTLVAACPAMAREYTVKMLNKSSQGAMVFEPAFTKIAPGDTVHFVATDKSHSAETIPGLLPAGAAPFASEISQDVTVKFTKSGVYGVRCRPHYGLGMVALIEVGKAGNLPQAKTIKNPPLAQRRLDSLFGFVK